MIVRSGELEKCIPAIIGPTIMDGWIGREYSWGRREWRCLRTTTVEPRGRCCQLPCAHAAQWWSSLLALAGHSQPRVLTPDRRRGPVHRDDVVKPDDVLLDSTSPARRLHQQRMARRPLGAHADESPELYCSGRRKGPVHFVKFIFFFRFNC